MSVDGSVPSSDESDNPYEYEDSYPEPPRDVITDLPSDDDSVKTLTLPGATKKNPLIEKNIVSDAPKRLTVSDDDHDEDWGRGALP